MRSPTIIEAFPADLVSFRCNTCHQKKGSRLTRSSPTPASRLLRETRAP